MRLQQFKALLINTLQREYRSKSLVAIFILTVAIIILVNSVMNLFMTGEGQPILANLADKKMVIFYKIINIWSGIIATLFGVHALKSDYDYDLVDQLWSFPIKKHDYIISRILGSWIVVCAYYLISIIMAMTLFSMSSDESYIRVTIIPSFMISSLLILTLIILGSLFSMFASKTIAFIEVLLASMFIAIANTQIGVLSFSEMFKNLSFMKVTGVVLHTIFPRIGVIDKISSNVLYEEPIVYNTLAESIHFIATIVLLYFILQKIIIKRGV